MSNICTCCSLKSVEEEFHFMPISNTIVNTTKRTFPGHLQIILTLASVWYTTINSIMPTKNHKVHWRIVLYLHNALMKRKYTYPLKTDCKWACENIVISIYHTDASFNMSDLLQKALRCVTAIKIGYLENALLPVCVDFSKHGVSALIWK